MRSKNSWALLLMMLTGIVIGGLLGQLLPSSFLNSCPDLWTDDPYHGREHYRNGNCHYFISFPVKQSGSCLSGVRTEYVSDKRKRHNTVTAL